MKKTFLYLLLMGLMTPCFGQWTQVNDAPFINDHSNGFGLNGKAYIIQGSPTNNAGQSQNRLWEYEPQTDTWTPVGFVPTPDRELAIGDDMDGKYYFGFGVQRKDVWEYDPMTNEFTELPTCPCATRAHPAFVAHNGKIFMGAGSGNNGDLNDWWVFDFDTQLWSQKANIPGPVRHHPFQFGIDNAIYVGGGHISNWLKFDINTETWTTIDDYPQGRVAGTQFSYNNMGFVLTGDQADHSSLTENQFLMYDPDVDQWYNLPFESSMHRWAPSSFIVDDFLYFFGGYGSNGGNDNHMWKFDLSYTMCIAPTNILAVDITENTSGIFWANSFLGTTDTLQWRELGATSWNTVLNPTPVYNLENLAPCTEYEFRVNSTCESSSVFSSIETFKTKGCGTCIDESYCDVSEEYLALNCHIDNVKINAYENTTGNNDGYQEFTSSSSIEVEIGGTFDLAVTPGFDFFPEPTNCKVWLDFNGDGDFSNDEKVVDVSQIIGTHLANVPIPTTAEIGLTRMRIAMDINTLIGPCQGSFLSDGEVEDYCLTLIEGNTTSTEEALLEATPVSIYPNPSTGMLSVENPQNHSIKVEVYELTGKLLWSELQPTSIHLNEYQDGLYLLSIENYDTQQITTEKLILKK